MLPGTWIITNIDGRDVSSTISVGPNGAYDGQVVARVGQDGFAKTFFLSGIFEVLNGLLIETTTKHSDTNAPVPMISTSCIIRIDEHELVMKYPTAPPGVSYPTNEIIFRKK